MKTALTIAGSDCSGGAGIQADIKTFSALGVYGMSVIVSVVAENTRQVIGIQDIEPKTIADQIDAVFEDIPPDAVKIGMLSTPACMAAVAERLHFHRPRNVIVDPVMYAKNGAPLMEPGACSALVESILPLADLVTPNLPEAREMTGISISNMEEMRCAAIAIHEAGAHSVLVKGGHLPGRAIDLLYNGESFHTFDEERIDTPNTHGTGCTYSSAIAAFLAMNLPMHEAVARAKAYVTTAIRHSLPLGRGSGPTHHFHDLYLHGLPKGETKHVN